MNQETPKVPKLRFKNKDHINFPDLELYTLGKIAKFKKGKGISKLDINPQGLYKCIRYGELFTTYDENIDEVVSNTEINPSGMILSEGNEVLMPTSDVTPRGLATASAISLKNIIIGGDILIINSDKINNLYLAYYIRFNKKQITRLVSGVTVYHIYSSDLNSFKINLPSLEEQKKISDFLETVDKYIQNLKSQKEELEKYKKGMMQKIFSQQIRFKEENERGYPKWECLKLSEIATFRRGSFPQPYGLPKWYDEQKGSPFIQVFDVGDDLKLKEKTKQKISDLAKPSSVFVKQGSIVLTIQGSIGRVAITQYDAYIDRTLLIFKSFNRPVDMYFFAYSLHLLFEIEKTKAPGGTIKTITKESLSNFMLSIPSLNEQQRIGNFFRTLDLVISTKQKQIEITELWKKGLMQQMFI